MHQWVISSSIVIVVRLPINVVAVHSLVTNVSVTVTLGNNVGIMVARVIKSLDRSVLGNTPVATVRYINTVLGDRGNVTGILGGINTGSILGSSCSICDMVLGTNCFFGANVSVLGGIALSALGENVISNMNNVSVLSIGA